MRYKLLGKSGLRVSELCLGTMTFGETWGWGASKEESRRIFDAFIAAGGNFIDTASNYTGGTSEAYLGEFIASAREQLVVATKYTLTSRADDPNGGGNSRKNLVQSLDTSLKRLRTDYVDLLWLHMWDGMTPVEEVMRALDDAVRAGKVLYVGISDTPAWVVAQANTLADLRGWSRFVALQCPYSLAGRTPERDLLPVARAFDMAVLAWGALEHGGLTGKYNQQTTEPKRFESASPQTLALAEAVMQLANTLGRSPAQVALNWVRQQDGRLIPLIGARTAAQARDNLACLEWELTPEQVQHLSELNPVALGFPQSFLASDEVTELIFGRTRPLIEA
ncbi:MAG TPA: aldo/keto reductase [Ktedonobacterales bacterium]|jgi:aryl-alcohol dehydrogenase-like predicted oxidoreductase|nr:aldo/keto reductase [Ktedonobacterales bacterium]